MNKIVGHIIHSGNHPLEEIGSAYNYRLAGNGLFVMSIKESLVAQIQIAEASVRGLPPADILFEMVHGKVPQRLFELALSVMLMRPEKEVYVGIAWDGAGYQLVVPEQEGSEAKVRYANSENIVVEMHSHPTFGPGFSDIDDRDELGFRVYGCVGELDDKMPNLNFRVGVYGYFMPVKWTDIFEGQLQGVIDIDELIAKDEKDEKDALEG